MLPQFKVFTKLLFHFTFLWHRVFEKDPSIYVPQVMFLIMCVALSTEVMWIWESWSVLNLKFFTFQWGGFCAWGIATETCPKYGWSPSCMGPHGSWCHWTIINQKIYFFWFGTAKTSFLNNADENILYGDHRWGGWYPDLDLGPVSTMCFEKEPVGSD